MSRFNQVGKVRTQAPAQVAAVVAPRVLAPPPSPAAPVPADIPPASDFSVSPPAERNMLATLGFVILCVYVSSGYLNEWTLRYFGEEDAGPLRLMMMLKPCHADRMTAFPVELEVGNVKNDNAGLMEELAGAA